jgi:hypothetical protein
MHVIAVHSISDPDKFFETAQSTPIPEEMTLHSLLPSSDRSRAVCVWEADSQDAVREFVESNVGDASQNEFFEVDAASAQGIPG